MLNPGVKCLLISGLALLGVWHHASAAELERLKYNHPGLVVDLGVGLWAFPLPMDFNRDGVLDLVVDCPDKPYNGVYVFSNPGTDTVAAALPIFKPGRRISHGLNLPMSLWSKISPGFSLQTVSILNSSKAAWNMVFLSTSAQMFTLKRCAATSGATSILRPMENLIW